MLRRSDPLFWQWSEELPVTGPAEPFKLGARGPIIPAGAVVYYAEILVRLTGGLDGGGHVRIGIDGLGIAMERDVAVWGGDQTIRLKYQPKHPEPLPFAIQPWYEATWPENQFGSDPLQGSANIVAMRP